MEAKKQLQILVNQLNAEWGVNYTDLDMYDKSEVKSHLEDLKDLIYNILDEL